MGIPKFVYSINPFLVSPGGLPLTQWCTRIWSLLGHGELTTLAELSAKFFEQHRRPLRIAADQPQWMSHFMHGTVHTLVSRFLLTLWLPKMFLRTHLSFSSGSANFSDLTSSS